MTTKTNKVTEAVEKLVEEGGYTLRGQVITDCGKFGGEHIMTLYFYDAYINGDGEPYGDDNDLKFNVTAEEGEAFDITEGAQVILQFSDQGFVTSYINN